MEIGEEGGEQRKPRKRELRRRKNGHSTCWSHSSVSAPLQVFGTLKQEQEEAAGVGRAGMVCPQQDTRVSLLSHLLHLPLVASAVKGIGFVDNLCASAILKELCIEAQTMYTRVSIPCTGRIPE